MEILSPVWPSTTGRQLAKQRPLGLAGVALALVDDNLDQAFTTHLEARLAAETGAHVRRWVKPSGTAPSPPELLDAAAAGVGAAVVGVGL
jgi:hypothetical protein